MRCLLGAATVSLLVMLLVPGQAAGANRANAIIFEIETSQGTQGRLTYVKNYGGRRNFAVLEVELARPCLSPFSEPYTETVGVSLPGRTRGNSFSARYRQNTSTDSFEQSASVRFRPGGRRGGLPRWRRASGTVRAYRAIHDVTTEVECNSGEVSFRSTSSRRTRIRPGEIVLVFPPPV